MDEEEPDAPEEKDSVALKVIFVEDEASHPLALISVCRIAPHADDPSTT